MFQRLLQFSRRGFGLFQQIIQPRQGRADFRQIPILSAQIDLFFESAQFSFQPLPGGNRQHATLLNQSLFERIGPVLQAGKVGLQPADQFRLCVLAGLLLSLPVHPFNPFLPLRR